MTLPALLNETWISPLINHLCQSTAVAAFAWLLALALRKNPARARYWVWMAGSVKFLLPFSLLMTAGEWMRSLTAAPIVVNSALANVTDEIVQSFPQTQFFDATSSPNPAHHLAWAPVTLLVAWICGALVVAIRFGRGWWMVWSAKRAARPLELTADVPVLCSPALIEPGIFGIFRPVLLMPHGILERLTSEQLKAIVAHEICHVRRRDNLTFAVHMVVETLFWFYPPVWWIGARLIEERERACDEAVLQSGSEAEVYAEGILNVCKFYAESPLECVAGVTGSDLKKRVVQIMREQGTRKLSVGSKVLISAAALLASGLPVAAGLGLAGWSLAQSQAQVDGAVPNLPKFEVASIKPSRPDDQSHGWTNGSGRVSIENYTLRRLIRVAYGLKSDSQVVGGPGWLDHKAFDIQAKFDETETAKLRGDMTREERFREYKLALQSLLADRFQLRLHPDSRIFPIYALVVAKGGAKLAKAAPTLDADGKPKAESHGIHVGDGHMTATGTAMGGLADWLTLYSDSDRIVLDRTGLTEDYDFKLDWTEDNGKGVPADAQYPGLFTALQEQLGLKLEPQRGPVAVVIVDAASEPVIE